MPRTSWRGRSTRCRRRPPAPHRALPAGNAGHTGPHWTPASLPAAALNQKGRKPQLRRAQDHEEKQPTRAPALLPAAALDEGGEKLTLERQILLTPSAACLGSPGEEGCWGLRGETLNSSDQKHRGCPGSSRAGRGERGGVGGGQPQSLCLLGRRRKNQSCLVLTQVLAPSQS